MYVPADPHEAYKMGVEDALKEARKDFSIPQVACVYIRKKLMGEHKEIWWFNIYENPKGRFYLSTCMWNSEEKAKQDPSPHLRGSYPVEIELPL